MFDKPILFLATSNQAESKIFYESKIGLNFVSGDPYALIFNVGEFELRGQVVDDLGCLNPLLSVEQSMSNFDLLVYPNPANSIVTIDIPFGQDLNLKVYDMNGRMVIHEYNLASDRLTLDVSKLNQGFYLFVLNDGLRTTRYKLVKD